MGEPTLTTIEELEHPGADKVLEKMGRLYQDYDRFLIESPDQHTDRPAGLHASEISSCPLKAYFTMTGVEKRTVRKHSKWRRRFEHGSALHEVLQKNLELMAQNSGGAYEFDKEVKITPATSVIAARHLIYSHCDGIVRMYRTKGCGRELFGRFALEIKSASPGEYEKITKPKTEHIEQGHVYMACLDLPAIYFMYYNKGNDNIKPSNGNFLVKFNPHLWEKLEQRFDGWYDLIDLGKKPEKKESIVCEFCPYSWTCKPDYLNKHRKEVVQRIVRFRR